MQNKAIHYRISITKNTQWNGNETKIIWFQFSNQKDFLRICSEWDDMNVCFLVDLS